MRVEHNTLFDDPQYSEYRTDFQTIEAFLEHTQRTGTRSLRSALRRFQQELDILVGRGMRPCDALWRELIRMEQCHRFSRNLATVTTALDDAEFFEILSLGRPIKDVGAEEKHGEYTHRIQWYLLMQEQDLGISQGLRWLGHDILDLYRTISGTPPEPRDRPSPGPTNLWEDLFDNTEDDGRSPEWLNDSLCGYRVGLPNYGALSDACRNRYEFREVDGYIGRSFGTRLQRTVFPGDAEITVDKHYARKHTKRPAHLDAWDPTRP